MLAIPPYVMATCQPRTQSVFGADGIFQPAILNANVDEYCRLIEQAARDHAARLIAFPQFGLTGHAMVNNAAWIAASLHFPGPEMDRIGGAARVANAYVIVQAAERHPAFPGRYFLSAAVVGPDGRIQLIYRKHYTMSLRTSPIDVYNAFVAQFGHDAFFPVLNTPIGCIGITIGAEVHWPEVTRSLALGGAEIIVNPVAAAPLLDYMNRPGALAVRAVRAFENVAYLAMPNLGLVSNAPASQIYDYDGRTIGMPVDAGDVFTLATINMEALRSARATPSANLLAQIQPAIHESMHALPLWPENPFPDHAVSSFDELIAVEAAAWRRMQELGRGKAPVSRAKVSRRIDRAVNRG